MVTVSAEAELAKMAEVATMLGRARMLVVRSAVVKSWGRNDQRKGAEGASNPNKTDLRPRSYIYFYTWHTLHPLPFVHQVENITRQDV